MGGQVRFRGPQSLWDPPLEWILLAEVLREYFPWRWGPVTTEPWIQAQLFFGVKPGFRLSFWAQHRFQAQPHFGIQLWIQPQPKFSGSRPNVLGSSPGFSLNFWNPAQDSAQIFGIQHWIQPQFGIQPWIKPQPKSFESSSGLNLSPSFWDSALDSGSAPI